MSIDAQAIRKLSPLAKARLKRAMIPRITPYIPHVPHAKQQFFLTLNQREALYGGAAGGGKALSVDANVLTPFGWVRNGDLKAGDMVTDPRTGRAVPVVVAHPAEDVDTWEVEFEDGQVIEASENHLWTVRCSGKRSKSWDARKAAGEDDPYLGGYTVTDTPGLLAMVAEAKSQQSRGIRPNWPHTPVARPVTFTVPYRNIDASLPLDPYVLGVLIGDGYLSKRKISVTTQDDEIADCLTHWSHATGGTSSVYQKSSVGAEVQPHAVRGVREVVLRGRVLVRHLQSLGILGKRSWDKHIPAAYLTAPIDYRYRLIQGLMDTDGYVDDRGHLSYTTTSSRLADDVAWLARSLGAYVKVTTKQTSGRLAYNVWITPHDPSGFVSLSRKAERLKVSQNPPNRRVVDVRRTERTTSMRCITVGTTDGLYITDGFVVTHNSDALLMAALQYVDVPGYSALILRRTYPDLVLPGAIMDRAKSWLSNTNALSRGGGVTWIFPSTARITFGHLQYDKNKYRYQSSEFQMIAFDELTQFEEQTYTYLFSRLRKPQRRCLACDRPIRQLQNNGNWVHTETNRKKMRQSSNACNLAVPDQAAIEQYTAADDGVALFDVPLRMRAASNPGGVGHVWVRDRFINPETREPGTIFVPASLRDNPSLDFDEYMESLSYLSPVERERLAAGDWDVEVETGNFQRHWFTSVSANDLPDDMHKVRFWDFAASKNSGDWTVGALLGRKRDDTYVILDIVRLQGTPGEVENAVAATAKRDGTSTMIVLEQEPGASGVSMIDNYRRRVLSGYNVRSDKPDRNKELRAAPFSVAAESGYVSMVMAPWNRDLLDELTLFPIGPHDDQVDAVSGAFRWLTVMQRSRIIV